MACPLITTGLPNGRLNQAYSQSVNDGSMPGTPFSFTGGTPPPGLTIGLLTGIISGTPTANGTFTFTVSAGEICNRQYTINIVSGGGGGRPAPNLIYVDPRSIPASQPIPQAIPAYGTWYSYLGTLDTGILIYKKGQVTDKDKEQFAQAQKAGKDKEKEQQRSYFESRSNTSNTNRQGRFSVDYDASVIGGSTQRGGKADLINERQHEAAHSVQMSGGFVNVNPSQLPDPKNPAPEVLISGEIYSFVSVNPDGTYLYQKGKKGEDKDKGDMRQGEIRGRGNF